MADNSPIAAAGQVLKDAIVNDNEPTARQEALNVLTELEVFLSSKYSGQVARVISAFAEQPERLYRTLLAILHPRWTNGGEELMDMAPPFADVQEDLMAGLRKATGDAAGMIPPLIGRYGPDAASVLPELLERLRTNRTDCMIAPGLPWTVYQIGGLGEEVREVLIEVAKGEDSCPHARPIAQEILTQNGISWE